MAFPHSPSSAGGASDLAHSDLAHSDLAHSVATHSASAHSASALAQASAERYRAIADSSFDLICELDSEGCFSYVSPSFGVTTGHDPGALEGTSLFDRVPDGDQETLVAEYTAALAGTRVGRARRTARRRGVA